MARDFRIASICAILGLMDDVFFRIIQLRIAIRWLLAGWIDFGLTLASQFPKLP